MVVGGLDISAISTQSFRIIITKQQRRPYLLTIESVMPSLEVLLTYFRSQEPVSPLAAFRCGQKPALLNWAPMDQS